MRIHDHWPALPMIEMAVYGETGENAPLVQALAVFLSEDLTGRAGPRQTL